MNKTETAEAGENNYFRWLLATSLLGNVVGWLVQGWLADDVVHRPKPASWATAGFHNNGFSPYN